MEFQRFIFRSSIVVALILLSFGGCNSQNQLDEEVPSNFIGNSNAGSLVVEPDPTDNLPEPPKEQPPENPGNPPIIPPPTTPPEGNAAAEPLIFELSGTGNHPKHICVPAQEKLRLRMTGIRALKKGYTKLRMRFSIQGIENAEYMLSSSNGVPSVEGNFSSEIGRGAVPTCIFPQVCLFGSNNLKTPEYKFQLYGSDRYDGRCTYWESIYRGCIVSEALTRSYTAQCAPNEQKVYIDDIQTNYTCETNRASAPDGWCSPHDPFQYALDGEQWKIRLEVITEDTRQVW